MHEKPAKLLMLLCETALTEGFCTFSSLVFACLASVTPGSTRAAEMCKLLARKYPPIDASHGILGGRVDSWIRPRRTAKMSDISAARDVSPLVDFSTCCRRHANNLPRIQRIPSELVASFSNELLAQCAANASHGGTTLCSASSSFLNVSTLLLCPCGIPGCGYTYR